MKTEHQDLDVNLSYVHPNSLNNTTIMERRSIKETINDLYISKRKQKGTFGQEIRNDRKEQYPGPGDYNTTELDFESHRKRIIAPHFKDKKPALKLPFALSNPLNYVNSYTVNVYYKPGHPGVGTYDVDKPGSVKGMAKFDSKTQRKLPFEFINNPGVPQVYDVKYPQKQSYGLNNSPGFCQPTKRKLVQLNLFGNEITSDMIEVILHISFL
jgi:hypothetical protein